MIGLVIVSHSARLAEGVCDLARQVAQGKVRIAAAGGTADPQNPIGTDAFRVLQAIDSVYREDGVLVLMDLGSAVLSAETALELLGEPRQSRVELCAAPLVEGAVAAASLAAAGADLAEAAREARNALAGKVAQLGGSGEQPQPNVRERFFGATPSKTMGLPQRRWSQSPTAWDCTRGRRRSSFAWRGATKRGRRWRT
jgi:phosphocarrier protein FPr